LHARNTTAYSLTKNSLCPECHNKPDKSQEDFDCCCESPDNAFLCENRRVGSQNKKNILKNPINTVLYINKMHDIAVAIAAMEWSWHNRN